MSQTQQQPQPNQKPAVELAEQRRLVGLVLRSSSTFNNSDRIVTTPSVAAPIATEVSIQPARVVASGDWRPCAADEIPMGFGLTQRSKTPRGEPFVKRGFIPLSQVCELIYAV